MNTERIIINDSKTLSGSAHVGSLRGPLVHDVLFRAAVDAGRQVEFSYGSDDYDALDAVPPYLLRDPLEQYLGMPLCKVPAPDGSGRSYSDYYLDEFLEVLGALGITPKVYRLSELYGAGLLNSFIVTALNRADTIRQIYFEVNQAERTDDWLPFQPICERCGRISTTRATRFDGDLVQYICQPSGVNYTVGCGYSGFVSPLNGSGKLPWKVEWAARWGLLGVNLEGAGKDHSIAGGSRDVAEAIARRVFEVEPPTNCPYEFFLVGKKKMSSSKGIGSTARDVANLIPPTQLRYLLARTKPKSAIDFRLDGPAIPSLFNQYDKAADDYLAGLDDGVSHRVLELSAVDMTQVDPPGYRPNFGHVATVIQIPGADVLQHFENHKGSRLTPGELGVLQERITCAKQWLQDLAPDEAKIELRREIPELALPFGDAEHLFLRSLSLFLQGQASRSGETIHKRIYDLASAVGISSSRAFEVIYVSLLGRPRGPRAGELLSALDLDFIVRRWSDIAGTARAQDDEVELP